MKRFLMASLLAGIAYLFTPVNVEAQAISIFTGVTANTDTTTMSNPPSALYLGVATCSTNCSWRVWSESTSSATVKAYCRISSSDSEPWYVCDSVADPGTPGSDRNLANEHDYKFAVEGYASGTIHVKFYKSSH